MAPTKSVKGKPSKGKNSGSSSKKGGASKGKSTGSAPEGISKRKAKSLSLAKPGGAQKSKSNSSAPNKRKRRTYTEAELDIPKLNGIIPAGIAKPKGQKKGKKFVDDPVSMMAIMSVVNADKEKNVESKIMRARQLEEVREAKRKEAEQRADEKSAKFVSVCRWGIILRILTRCRRKRRRVSRRRGRADIAIILGSRVSTTTMRPRSLQSPHKERRRGCLLDERVE
jgi:60S ribosomal subunit assembly/export protein LOC1